MNYPRIGAGIVLAMLGLACEGPRSDIQGEDARSTELLVFAAASLEDVATALGSDFEAQHPEARVVYSFAGSNALAAQILVAPRAAVFLSANEQAMARLEKAGQLMFAATPFASNRLVLIAHVESPTTIDSVQALSGADYTRLFTGDPELVPAGMYAQAFLTAMLTTDGHVWGALKERLVPMLDVRAVLGAVARERSALGIVYASDVDSRVRVLCEIPSSGPPIRYVAGRIVGHSPLDSRLAAEFVSHWRSPAAAESLTAHGFSHIEP